MYLYFIIIGACLYFQAERGIFDFFSYLRLFQQFKKQNKINQSASQKLYILIPALCEQMIIEETILSFCKIKNPKIDIEIAIITSVREKTNKLDGVHPTTDEVVAKSMDSGKLREYSESIHVFQDPARHGNMATQLNYAIKKIKYLAKPDDFYMVFNADSIISKRTIEKFSQLIGQYPGKEFAFQQPCAFVRDMGPAANQFTNALSLYQSWYCLGHESRLVRNYDDKSKKYWNGKEHNKLGVIVGHGSGMTFNINTSNNGYPTDLLTEDLTFGFILSADNIPILSLQALEVADVPNRYIMFIKQKSVWFWNFLGYPSCYKKTRAQGFSRYRPILLLIQGIGAGAYWFFDTFFIITPLLLGITLGSYQIVLLSLISFLFFYITPQYFLLQKLPTILAEQGFPIHAQNVRNTSFIKLLPSLCLIILTNSVGAWIATIRGVKYLLTGKLPKKYKTGD